jgi:hypothetical protein
MPQNSLYLKTIKPEQTKNQRLRPLSSGGLIFSSSVSHFSKENNLKKSIRLFFDDTIQMKQSSEVVQLV